VNVYVLTLSAFALSVRQKLETVSAILTKVFGDVPQSLKKILHYDLTSSTVFNPCTFQSGIKSVKDK
jgi:hypothetical protein